MSNLSWEARHCTLCSVNKWKKSNVKSVTIQRLTSAGQDKAHKNGLTANCQLLSVSRVLHNEVSRASVSRLPVLHKYFATNIMRVHLQICSQCAQSIDDSESDKDAVLALARQYRTVSTQMFLPEVHHDTSNLVICKLVSVLIPQQ